MFIIDTIWLTNFKSFSGSHQIRLPSTPGLYFFTGKNEAEPSLDTNGVGKSTILDAIHWCLYGSTLRGLRGPDIINWNKKSAEVTLSLQILDRKFKVKRAQSPNSLVLIENGTETILEQDALQKIIRINPTSFIYSVVMPQFGNAFFDLGPSQKLTIFSEITDLNFWLLKSKDADKEAKTLEEGIAELKTAVATNIGRSNLLKEDIDQLLLDEARFYKQKSIEREQTASHKQQMLANKGKYEELLGEWRELSDKEQAIVKLLEKKEAQNRAKLNECREAKEAASKRVAVLENSLEALLASKTALGELGAECTTCHQPISKMHVQGQQTALMRRLKPVEQQLAEAKAELTHCKDELQKQETIEAERRKNLNRAERQLEGAEEELQSVKQSLNGVLRDLANIDQKSAVKEVNPYTAQIENKKKQCVKTKELIKEDTDKIRTLEAEHQAVSYWINGFKRIRLFLIEDTIRSLEIEINNSLHSLGLQDWRIELDVERENKTGGVTKGFTVLVYAPKSQKAVKWEAFSGGEIQRLRMAGDLGLANLIMTRAGLVNTIEFYDEPSQHLSPKGLLDLVETLNDRALDGGKAIVLIDHHTIEYGHFADTFMVMRDANGSYVA